MITKEELEKLIKEEATIYYYDRFDGLIELSLKGAEFYYRDYDRKLMLRILDYWRDFDEEEWADILDQIEKGESYEQKN